MGVEIWLDHDSHPGIDASGLSPGISQGQGAAEFGRLEVLDGCRLVRAETVFRIVDSSSQDDLVTCRGDWSAVQNLAAGMNAGNVAVQSALGTGAGRGMRGGRLMIHGDAGDDLGQSMRGGWIVVSGNAGDRAGSSSPGTTAGMNRGSIIVHGNCGTHAGMRMRRGTLVVGGDCGEMAGYEMRGGTLIIGGKAGELAGHGMRRGTIVLLMKPDSLDGGFRPNGVFASPFHRMLGRTAEWTDLQSSQEWPRLFECFAGDWLYGSRGELAVGMVNAIEQVR